MKPSNSIISTVVIILLATGLTVASLQYIRPMDCQRLCQEPIQAPCPSGSCRSGEQRAGFPLPVLQDEGTGSSPTGGWGKLGPEDLPNPVTFVLDVLVYSVLLWFVWRVIRVTRGKEQPRALLAIAPLMAFALITLIAGFLRDRTSPTFKSLAGAPPEVAILGKWTATDVSPGREFTFRFYDGGEVSMTLPGFTNFDDRWVGKYKWTSNSAMRMTFGPTSSHSGGKNGLCGNTPSFFKGLCHYSVVEPFNPASYPGPVGVPPTANPGPYPVPSPETKGLTSIDELFNVDIDGNSLTLTHPSGTAQTFHRVTSN